MITIEKWASSRLIAAAVFVLLIESMTTESEEDRTVLEQLSPSVAGGAGKSSRREMDARCGQMGLISWG